jgi:hypothetical protein
MINSHTPVGVTSDEHGAQEQRGKCRHENRETEYCRWQGSTGQVLIPIGKGYAGWDDSYAWMASDGGMGDG